MEAKLVILSQFMSQFMRVCNGVTILLHLIAPVQFRKGEGITVLV